MLAQELEEAVCELYNERLDSLVSWCNGRFPRMCRSRAEDAVHNAFVAVLACPETFEKGLAARGPAELERLVRTVAWRELRGQWRRKSYQSEVPLVAVCAPHTHTTPYDVTVANELLTEVELLADEAAVIFGGNRSRALRDALRARVSTGNSDSGIAREHGVPREYLSKAKNWMKRQLAA